MVELEAVGDGRAIARINFRRECRILDHVCLLLSCRVSHGIAGTLLGEMALCAKKRPPGKSSKEWVSGTMIKGAVIMT